MHIIGGGVVGLCSAWYLRKAGFDVTVVDNATNEDGCSFGNAGLITPSHCIPLASPGVISKGLRWMFRGDSPFYIKPGMDPNLLRWLWRFYRSCTRQHADAAAPLLRDLHLLSKSLYTAFADEPGFDFSLEARGCLMLYRTESGRHEELESAEYAHRLGLSVSELDQDAIQALHPGMTCNVLGGVHYHDDAHFQPGLFMRQLRASLARKGVTFESATVIDFETQHRRITGLRYADGRSESIQQLLLATGAWTGRLGDQLGLRMLIQDGKGYSVTLGDLPQHPAIPSILTEARVAVTPMGHDLRIGGTLEISGFSSGMNQKRVRAMLQAMQTYYPSFPTLHPEDLRVWSGYRPVSADGLPYVGRSNQFENLMVAAGHAMLGMSLGPVTGLLVSEIALEQPMSLAIDLLSPARHGTV